MDETESAENNGHKEIIMRQFNNLAKFSNVEWRGGFYSKFTDKNGETRDTYINDTREIFDNAVYALALILEPDFDEKMKESWLKFSGNITLIQQEFMNKTNLKEEVILGEIFYPKSEDKINLETYKYKKLILHQQLYLDLSRLLHRLQYFDLIGGTFGGTS